MTDSSAPTGLREALQREDPSVRLRSALAAGTRPDAAFVGILLERCAVEPDFFVRDMLTWALARHPPELTVPLLLHELSGPTSQARSQALHTLSKIGDPSSWPAITRELLEDPDDEVARSAWRAAVALVPHGAEGALAETLATQLGRGDRDVRLSLSRAFVGLGEPAVEALTVAATRGTIEARTHAIATRRLLLDPEENFDESVFEATRTLALLNTADAAEPPNPDDPEEQLMTATVSGSAPEPSPQDVLAERLRVVLASRSAVREVRMFGGLSFMVDGRLAVSAGRDGDLLVSTDPAEYDALIGRGAEPARMRNGRAMGRGWLTVSHQRIEGDEELAFWVAVGIASRKPPS